MTEIELCPIEATLTVIDGKWTLLLLRDLLAGTKRFGALQRSLRGISPKTLTERLRVLEEHGIVERTIYPEIPPRVEYTLTAYGLSLRPILEAMAVWGWQHIERTALNEPADDQRLTTDKVTR